MLAPGRRVIRRFKPSLQVLYDLQGPHLIGRESDLLSFDWLDVFALFAPILIVIVYGP